MIKFYRKRKVNKHTLTKKGKKKNNKKHAIILCYLLHLVAGIFMVPTKNLIQPDRSRMIRSLDANFVQSLKKKMELNPSAPGVPPIVVMCVDLEVSI